MQKTIAFDIETIADPEQVAQLPPIENEVKLGQLKDKVKIDEKLKEAEQKRLENLGLDPHRNMICCFGWCDGENSDAISLSEATGSAERDLIQNSWEVLYKHDHFVTFNGIHFDVKILNLHSLFRNLIIPFRISTQKYRQGNHTDLRMILGDWDTYAPGNLDFYLRRILGVQKMTGIDGAMVQHYWDVGMVDEIKKYCKDDAEKTYQLYAAIKELGYL